MDTIGQGFIEAFRLIFAGDAEIFEIVGLSLYVSFSSVVISTILGIPLGILLGTCSFRGKGIIVRIIYTLMSLPPVIAGLVVFLILMRRVLSGKSAAQLFCNSYDNRPNLPCNTNNNRANL